MSEVVQMRVQDGVALLTLNRPDRLNAWTAEMEHAYFAMLDQCAREQEVRVIVVTGAGRGFCAGADMQELQAIGDGTLTATAETHERRAQTFPLSIPKPIIAAVNGACAGIGLVQALMCDIRFAAEGAKLSGLSRWCSARPPSSCCATRRVRCSWRARLAVPRRADG